MVFFFAFLMGCSKFETLNLERHLFNKVPENVIWFQIAGLDEEHLAMLRFNLKDNNSKSSFEEAACIGKAWSYNLYNLRPGPKASFQSQISSSKNIKGTCEDFKAPPFWSGTEDEIYQYGIFELGATAEQSYVEYSNCAENEFNKELVVWSMLPPPKEKGVRLFSEKNYQKGRFYFDSSCKKKGVCFSSLQANVQAVWSKFSESKGKKVFIIRDYSYLNLLLKKKILEAREVLSELEKIHSLFKLKLKSKNNTLFLVTSGSPRKFEFPKKGKDWSKFERTGRKIIYRSDSLLSLVMAEGSAAENFCGIFGENEIGKRIFWSPRAKKLKLFNF